jgi:Gas vesicle synthesis protein GvpL/GvpF
VAERDAAFEALREAIEEFAVERAPELVAEARAEATARVRSMLSEAMAHALLDHTREHLGASHSAPPAPPKAQPKARRPSQPARRRAEPSEPRIASEPSEPRLACYVYGVARAGEAEVPPDAAGVDPDQAVTLIEHEGLAALTSNVSLAEFGEEELRENLNDVEWLEEKARAHEGVLDAALARATVVPMRLCTIYRSDQHVREMLDREHEPLADALDRLEGKSEWSVKLIAEPGALSRAADDGEAGEGAADVAPGAAYMRERSREARVREALDELAEAWTLDVHERLASRSIEALVNPLQNPEVSGHEGDMLLNGAYLVADADLDAFRDEVAALQREHRKHGASVVMSGPWPPYNFVERSIETTR